MSKNELSTEINHEFLECVSDVLAKARKNAKTAVNLSMVYAYFEIGRMIVEEEQHGANRAAYGVQLLKELSSYLTAIYGRGFSVTNLKQMRQFLPHLCQWTKLVRHSLTNLRISQLSALGESFT